MRQLTSTIFEGVPERFPNLRIAYLEAGCGWAPYWAERMEDFLHHAPTKLLLVVPASDRDRLAAEVKPRFSPRVSVVRTDAEYLEFLHPEADKGKGITRLAEIFGIGLDEVMAVGDGENDLPMIQCAGWGVAVANANERCKVVAKGCTVRDHNNDAVAEAIERWVL
jgi:hydroxymethylpyrimidine pyrophosphatase-like HAD family hydrolase